MTSAAVAPSAALVPGTVLGERFEITGTLGQGGMGTVYTADDSATDHKAAVKVLHPHLTSSREYVSRFKREGQVATRFRHEAAVRTLATGETESGLPYIAMELVEGRSLKEIIYEDAPMPVGRALNIAQQVLRALGAAHRRGIVHRDVKPDNIRIGLDDDGIERPKLLDFGVAKFISGEMPEEVTGGLKTKTGVILGTPKYMSPEQIRGEAIDGRSDIYAVGAMIYEMIAGVPPFQADDVFGFVTKHLKERVRPISEAHPAVDIDVEVDDLVLRMLAKDPTDRPVDAQALAVEMDPFAIEDPRLAEKGRALRNGISAVALAGILSAVLTAVFADTLYFVATAAALGLALGASLAAARFPRPSVHGYVRRLGFVAGTLTLAELLAVLFGGAPISLACTHGLVGLLVYVAFLSVWGSRKRWLRPLVAGLAAPFAAMTLLPVLVEQEKSEVFNEPLFYFVRFLDKAKGAEGTEMSEVVQQQIEALESTARIHGLLGVLLVALPFGLAAMLLPRPGAARL